MLANPFFKITEPYLTASRWIIALSGGLDSTVLLQLVHQLKEKFLDKKLGTLKFPYIQAVYINHQLSPHSKVWQEHAQQLCATYHIDFLAYDIEPAAQSTNLEEYLREARYAVFKRLILSEQDYLLTAHHQNDQVETFFYRLFRGSSLKGLAAMKMIQPFAKGYIFRPLLNISRQDLLQYAQSHGLSWVEDESNRDERFDRNFIRHQVLPLIKTRWDSIDQNACRLIANCRESEILLHELAEIDLSNLSLNNNRSILNLNQIKQLSQERQYNLLYYWLKRLQPNRVLLEHILKNIIQAKTDASPLMEFSGFQIRRYQEKLYLISQPISIPANFEMSWDIHQKPVIQLPYKLGQLQVKRTTESGLVIQPDDQVKISFRQGGERFHPQGKTHSCSLKHFFQEQHIEPWRRGSWPLIYVNDQLACVVNLSEADLKQQQLQGSEAKKYQFQWVNPFL